jgi:signal peptidase I
MARSRIPVYLGRADANGLRTKDAPPPLRNNREVKPRSARRLLVEWLVFVLVAVGISVALRAYVLQAYYIPSASMEPTLEIGDRILVNRLAYDLHGVGFGDVVVFRAPRTLPNVPTGSVLVKRVIGLPGQTISSDASGHVIINGRPISDPWGAHSMSGLGIPIRKQTVPRGCYFMMGDNRGDSEDSRFFGPVCRNEIIGKVDAVIWRNGHPDFEWL